MGVRQRFEAFDAIRQLLHNHVGRPRDTLGDELPRVHDSQRIECVFDRSKRVDPARRSEPLKLVALELPDTVLG